MPRIKKTIAQQAYEREVRNLKRRIKTVEKQGYETNLEIKNLAARKYTSNTAANRAALKKIKSLTNEMLKRSNNIKAFNYEVNGKTIKLNPEQYTRYMEEKKRLQKELAKERRGYEYKAKNARLKEIEAEEIIRAEKQKRPVDVEKAKVRARAKDEQFIQNFSKGWRESFADIEMEGTAVQNELDRFKTAMEWVLKRGFYTKLEILQWADLYTKNMITLVFDSDEPTTKSINMAEFEAFIEHITKNYGYNEKKELERIRLKGYKVVQA